MGNENSVPISDDQYQVIKHIVKYFKSDTHIRKPPYKKLDLSRDNISSICQDSSVRNYIIEPIRFVTKDSKSFVKLYRKAILGEYEDVFFERVKDGILKIINNLRSDDPSCRHRELLISKLDDPSNKKKYKVIDLQTLTDIVHDLGDNDAKTEMIGITAGQTEYPKQYDDDE